MNPKHTIFVTGAAGYVGAMLVDVFSKREDVMAVVAIDKEPIPDFIKDAPKLTYIEENLSHGTWQDKVAAIRPDIVIHAAWQIREMYGKKALQRKWNIGGSDAVFDFAFSTPSVKRLVYFSTVASYGAFPSNTTEHRFAENEPFRKTDYLYAEEKRISEEHLKEKFEAAKKNGSKAQVAIIRPASITGPRGRYMMKKFGLQSALSGGLKGQKSFLYAIISLWLSLMPATPKWLRQYVHEDDIADIADRLAFGELKNDYDAFNAAPPGATVSSRDMAEAVGKKVLRIRPWMVRLAFFWVWHLTRGRIPTSPGVWKTYSYPIAVDGSKLTRMYGYRYKWQSKDAFMKSEGRYVKYVKQ